jgi:hypothetical protein
MLTSSSYQPIEGLEDQTRGQTEGTCVKQTATSWTSYKIRKMWVMACPLPVVAVGMMDPGTNNGLNSYTRIVRSEIDISVSLV